MHPTDLSRLQLTHIYMHSLSQAGRLDPPVSLQDLQAHMLQELMNARSWVKGKDAILSA